jgi:hypothetical protein
VNLKPSSKHTKTELYEMLAAAVRNTQPQPRQQRASTSPKRTTETKRIRTIKDQKQRSK